MGWATLGGDECLVRRVVDDLIVARVYQRVDLGQSERGDYLAWRLWWRDMARGIPQREWLNLATCHVVGTGLSTMSTPRRPPLRTRVAHSVAETESLRSSDE